MLGKINRLQLLRGAVASCLTLLLSFASLTPLAARAFSDSPNACCRTHGKCCCKKTAHRSAGPAFDEAGCRPDCGQFAITVSGGRGLLKPSPVSIAPPAQGNTGTELCNAAVSAPLAEDSLRQRPPPSSLHG